MVAKIALEEHFLCPGFEDYWNSTVEDVPPAIREKLVERLTDFGELRLSAMDEAGIERSVLGLSGPGVQIEKDTDRAVKNAKQANDFLAEKVAGRPDRYSGFAHLPMQDPAAAADELERCQTELGFCGAMINGHTNGVYLDDPSNHVFWERAEALGALIYLHPADPVSQHPSFEGHRALKRATWEWTVETGTHTLRMVFSGLFDRFPKARLALGHLGETLPYLLWRLDSRARLYGVKLDRPPSQTIRENILVTMSGMFSKEPLQCAISALGHEKVMFSADYPFESSKEAGEFADRLDLPADMLQDLCRNNALRELGLA